MLSRQLTRGWVMPILAALIGSAPLLVACGESDEEKAQNAVCDARADIETRVNDLAGLTITTASIEQVTNSLEAIRDDLEKIASDQKNLEPERRQEVEEAGKRFRSQVETTAKDLVSGATSGEEAGASLGSALDELAKSFREAYAPVDCDQQAELGARGRKLGDGRRITPELVRELEASELERIRAEIGDDDWFENQGRPDLSRSLFERVALSGDDFVEFLTLPAYEELLKLGG